MQNSDRLLRTKIHLPSTRLNLVLRSRLREKMLQGLQGPVTLVIAPAGFGKSTLVISCIADCKMPVAWLSLDKNDNDVGRFLNYVVAALQETDNTIGHEASQLLAALQQAQPETILTSLINDLDSGCKEMILVLDDYYLISSQAVHDAVAFLLEHFPNRLHLVIASRSDPPLPLARLRARAQIMELRSADLRFTEPEAAQFLNDVMGLRLDSGSVAALAERTEGWITGLQMAALSMRDREDISGFIRGFSGTNRYILDYLLQEVLASQSPEVQRFLLCTSILERLTAPLCDAILENNGLTENGGDDRAKDSKLLIAGQSASILEYLERANLFLVPLDDERVWYRYHNLFADLLRTQLQKSLGARGVAQLHVCAAEWHAGHGSILDAINHASAAGDDERVERFIEQNYMEMVRRGDMSEMRSWTGKVSKELVYRRPWLCIYAAYSHSWFGELDEADRLLEEAEKRIQAKVPLPEDESMLAHLIYVKSRVTAMRGDLRRAVELCLAARAMIPASNLSLQFDSRVTLGYEYFLGGDYANASPILNETIRAGLSAGAVINTVAASCLMARQYAVQGLLKKSYETYEIAAQLIANASEEHRDGSAIVEIGMADVLCEWNELDAALAHVKQGLALMPWWGKADDFILAYVTLARIHLAQGSISDATENIRKAFHLIQTSGVFPEAPQVAGLAQVKLWLATGDVQAATRWAASREECFDCDDRFDFENELPHIAQVRVFIALNRPGEALGLLSKMEEPARSAGRMGRVIEMLLLEAFARQQIGDLERTMCALTECLTLAEPEGYVRIFLDEGRPMQMLLAQWLARAGVSASPVRDYVIHLLSRFDGESHAAKAVQEKVSHIDKLAEPLSQRELEVLHLIAVGKTNQEIARQLIVAAGTVKAHTASIYRKLDVANRTEAVARGRQLGILF